MGILKRKGRAGDESVMRHQSWWRQTEENPYRQCPGKRLPSSSAARCCHPNTFLVQLLRVLFIHVVFQPLSSLQFLNETRVQLPASSISPFNSNLIVIKIRNDTRNISERVLLHWHLAAHTATAFGRLQCSTARETGTSPELRAAEHPGWHFPHQRPVYGYLTHSPKTQPPNLSLF